MNGSTQILPDRTEAGRRLARALSAYADRKDVVVLGLPRGGLVVAFEIAKALDVPLDVLVVRKLGVPGHEELAFGAIAGGGTRVTNPDVVRMLRLTPGEIDAVVAREQGMLEQRERFYRGHSRALELEGKTVILVDDGLATGASMRTAIRLLRNYNPERIVMAVPVAPRETCSALEQEVDEAVCLAMPEPFYAIGSWYHDFTQTSDEEVIELLDSARAFGRSGGETGGSAGSR